MLPVLVSLLAAAAAPTSTSVLVLPVKVVGDVPQGVAAALTASLTTEAGRVPGFRVIALAEVEQTLGQESLRTLVTCDSASCVAEVAGAMNTDELVLTQLARVGNELHLAGTRLKAQNAEVLARAASFAAADKPEGLLRAAGPFVRELFAVTAPAPGQPTAVVTNTPPVATSPVTAAPVADEAPAWAGIATKSLVGAGAVAAFLALPVLLGMPLAATGAVLGSSLSEYTSQNAPQINAAVFAGWLVAIVATVVLVPATPLALVLGAVGLVLLVAGIVVRFAFG